MASAPIRRVVLDLLEPHEPTTLRVRPARGGRRRRDRRQRLPVATPPNAIVSSAGEVTRRQMLRAGVLDVVVIVVATGTIALLARFVWPATVE